MLRQLYNVPPGQQIAVGLRAVADRAKQLAQYKDLIERSARVKAQIAAAFAGTADTFAARETGPDELATPPAKAVVGSDIEIVMPLGGVIDFAAEKARIAKDIGKAEKEIATLEGKLAKPDFLAKADPEVVAENRARLADEQLRRQRLVDALATLGAAR
jgi:valyl-tRNA synthetase